MSEHIVTVASTTDIILATMWRELLAAEGPQTAPDGTRRTAGILPVRRAATPRTRIAR